MKIFINSKEIETKTDIALSGFVEEQGLSSGGTAIAVNGRVVPKPEWNETVLKENDNITVIRPMCGG
ncbi:MAG: sulfur carrier protein ThiS [Candidatus Azobacteroides sp.]|nr:sulfur carrier protein ThiS [Candidatus Azobacteroides sp.]